MKENFDNSLHDTLYSEGGLANNKHDPGGLTNKGITQVEYDRFRADESLPLQSVVAMDDNEMQEIYNRDYWGLCHCDVLPAGVDYCVFDFAVNSGPGRAVRYLQQSVGVIADGRLGPVSFAAIDSKPPSFIIEALSDERLAYLQKLPTFRYFGKGWAERVQRVEDQAKGMIMATKPTEVAPAPKPEAVAPNQNVIDGLQAAGRYAVVIVGFMTAVFGLFKTRDIAGMISYIETNGGSVLAAISGLIALGTAAYGVFKSQKRGAQVANAAANPAVDSLMLK